MKMESRAKVCNIKHSFGDFSFNQNDKLGQGGFATVYKAQCTTRCYQTFVAIKEISKNDVKWRQHKKYVKNERKIHGEAEHDNIVKLYHYLEDSTRIWLIMELCSKGSLQEYLKIQKKKAFSEKKAYIIFRQIVDGVTYLHSKYIIHRDLTLRNILLTDDMQVKIADFGLSTKLQKPDDTHYTQVGTPKYLPPEMKKMDGHSDKADCWNLGCILHALLLGNPPVKGERNKNLDIISQEARTLLEGLLEENPNKRICIEEVHDSAFFQKYDNLKRDACGSGYSSNRYNNYTKENKIPARSFDSGFNSKDSEIRKNSRSANKFNTGFYDNKYPLTGTISCLHHSYQNQQLSSCYNPEKLSLRKLEQMPPLNVARLKPKSHHIKNRKIVVHILADSQVILECHKIKGSVTFVSEMLSISTDGMEVKVYNPPKHSLLAGDHPPHFPSDSLEVKSYEYPNIIEAYMKKYVIAKKFVDTLRAKTPKLINHGANAKFYVMENSPDPDCKMDFYDGFVVVEKGKDISVTHKSGRRVESSRKAVLEEEYWHEKENCKRILEFHESLESPNFPIVLGMERNALYNPETKSGKENALPLSSMNSRGIYR